MYSDVRYRVERQMYGFYNDVRFFFLCVYTISTRKNVPIFNIKGGFDSKLDEVSTFGRSFFENILN